MTRANLSASVLMMISCGLVYMLLTGSPGNWLVAAGIIVALTVTTSLGWTWPVDHDAIRPDEAMPRAEVEARVLALFNKRVESKVKAILLAPRQARGAGIPSFEKLSVEVSGGAATGNGIIRGRWCIEWSPALPDGTTEEHGVFAADASWHLTRWPWPKLAIDSVDYRSDLFGRLLDLVPIPAGSFMMGSAEGTPGARDSEYPQHRQAIEGFGLARTPTTRLQWAMVMGGATPDAPDEPHVNVRWFDAIEFCQILSTLSGLTNAYTERSSGEYERMPRHDAFRLPTEVEWEYACRAGTTTAYAFGDDPEQLDQHAWYDGNNRGLPRVAQKPANPWGLHDMHGTVWEWCWSSFQPYPLEDELRPVGALRVLRGGSFYIGAAWLRSAIRLRGAPGDRYRVVGFRCSGPFLPSSALEP